MTVIARLQNFMVSNIIGIPSMPNLILLWPSVLNYNLGWTVQTDRRSAMLNAVL